MIIVTIVAHHALGHPITEQVTVACSSHGQVAAALAALYLRAKSLLGVGTIRRVDVRRERIAA